VNPTRPRDLLAAALAALVLALAVARVTGRSSLPVLPLAPAIAVGVVGLVELGLVASVRARLAGRPGTRPIVPLTVARVAALARASSLTAALATGTWAGLLVDRLTRLGGVHAVRADAVVAAAGVFTGLLLLAAALRLEGVCRVRPGSGGGSLS